MVFLIAHFENILKNDCQVKDRLLYSNEPDIPSGGMKYAHINLALWRNLNPKKRYND
jgi:hypothetical protein